MIDGGKCDSQHSVGMDWDELGEMPHLSGCVDVRHNRSPSCNFVMALATHRADAT